MYFTQFLWPNKKEAEILSASFLMFDPCHNIVDLVKINSARPPGTKGSTIEFVSLFWPLKIQMHSTYWDSAALGLYSWQFSISIIGQLYPHFPPRQHKDNDLLV